jgi:hypothetical protein
VVERTEKMNYTKEKAANHTRYYPSDTASACALCGGGQGSVYFKGRLICEECIDIVKGLY